MKDPVYDHLQYLENQSSILADRIIEKILLKKTEEIEILYLSYIKVISRMCKCTENPQDQLRDTIDFLTSEVNT